MSTGENYNDLVTTVINDIDKDDNRFKLIVAGYYFVIIFVSFFCIIPLIIVRFENLYHSSEERWYNQTIEMKTNAILASFILIDIDKNETISKDEFEQIFDLRDVESIAPNLMNLNNSNSHSKYSKQLSLPDYVDAMLTERLICDRESDTILTNKFQSYLECKWINNPIHRWCGLLFGIMPGVVAGASFGLDPINDTVLTCLMIFSFVYNLFDILIKMYALGGTPLSQKHMYNVNIFNIRYFNYAKYDDPPFVQWCEYQKKLEKTKSKTASNNNNINTRLSVSVPVSLSYLNHNDWIWCNRYLSENWVPDERELWQRKYDSTSNWFDFCLMFVSSFSVVYILIFAHGIESMESSEGIGYLRMWLIVPTLRAITLLKQNAKIFFELSKVVSQGRVVDIFIFVFLFVIIWARIGVTLFYGISKRVPEEVYSSDANTSFDSLTQAVLALVQISIGDSWGDIMYVNVIAANSFSYIWYFAFFVLVITLLFINIVIGIILTGVDTLENKMNS